MKKLTFFFCLLFFSSLSAAKDLPTKLNEFIKQYQVITEYIQPNSDQNNIERYLLSLSTRKAPYAMIYEHTGLYQWELLSKCFYDYEIDSSTSITDIDVDYKPNDDLFNVIPAYFSLYTERPYSSLENYKSAMVAAFKSLGTGNTVLIDKSSTKYGYPGYEYCLSFNYSGSRLLVYCQFLKIEDICCLLYYMTGESYYNSSSYKVFFDVIMSIVDFKPFTRVFNERQNHNEPLAFILNQNFPNPFNASTTINYSIARTASIKLELFNINGELVRTIFDKPHASGDYTFNLNLDDVASGVYFYRLSDNANFKIQRMILMK